MQGLYQPTSGLAGHPLEEEGTACCRFEGQGRWRGKGAFLDIGWKTLWLKGQGGKTLECAHFANVIFFKSEIKNGILHNTNPRSQWIKETVFSGGEIVTKITLYLDYIFTVKEIKSFWSKQGLETNSLYILFLKLLPIVPRQKIKVNKHVTNYLTCAFRNCVKSKECWSILLFSLYIKETKLFQPILILIL